MSNLRIGTAYDIHRLEDGKGITLANFRVDCSKQVVAHSDGDVVIHTLIDCILGALALGNIGEFFPDNELKYKNISSASLLEQVLENPIVKKFSIVNFDCTVILEAPKLKEYILVMRESLASLLSLEITCISIKATTHEKIDTLGRGEAIACQAVILLSKK